MKKAKHYLNLIFPFIAVLILWRLDSHMWNPCGVLAIIPIFYYSFIRPRAWFLPMAYVGTILLDFSFDTLLFWTAMFSAAYAANGLQSRIDLTRQKSDGLYVFLAFFGLSLAIIGISASITGISLIPMFRSLWMLAWAGVLYIPFSKFAREVSR